MPMAASTLARLGLDSMARNVASATAASVSSGPRSGKLSFAFDAGPTAHTAASHQTAMRASIGEIPNFFRLLGLKPQLPLLT
jgi:hypothetical protein